MAAQGWSGRHNGEGIRSMEGVSEGGCRKPKPQSPYPKGPPVRAPVHQARPTGDTSPPPHPSSRVTSLMREMVCQTVQNRRLYCFFLQNQFKLEMVLQTRNGFARRNKTILRLEPVENRKMVCQTILRTKWFCKKNSIIFGFARFGRPVCNIKLV